MNANASGTLTVGICKCFWHDATERLSQVHLTYAEMFQKANGQTFGKIYEFLRGGDGSPLQFFFYPNHEACKGVNLIFPSSGLKVPVSGVRYDCPLHCGKANYWAILFELASLEKNLGASLMEPIADLFRQDRNQYLPTFTAWCEEGFRYPEGVKSPADYTEKLFHQFQPPWFWRNEYGVIAVDYPKEKWSDFMPWIGATIIMIGGSLYNAAELLAFFSSIHLSLWKGLAFSRALFFLVLPKKLFENWEGPLQVPENAFQVPLSLEEEDDG